MIEGSEEQLWAAVAEPGRRRLLDALVAHGEATPTTLAAEVPFSRQAVSKHLAVLVDAGLVTQRREGREVRYTIQPDRLHAAARTMLTTANRWNARLQAIKRIAEALHRADQATPEGPLGVAGPDRGSASGEAGTRGSEPAGGPSEPSGPST